MAQEYGPETLGGYWKEMACIAELSGWMSDRRARFLGISDRKGSIQLGRDADLVVWNEEKGQVEKTILRGHVIYARDKSNLLAEDTLYGVTIVPTRRHILPSAHNPFPPPCQRLNTMSYTQFFNIVKLVFEDSAPLARELYDNLPLESYRQMLELGESIMNEWPHQDKMVVINSHPRIGVNANDVKTLSSLSRLEQGLGDDTSTAVDLAKVQEELQRLNHLYEEKYGFRFMIFVNGRPKPVLIPIFQDRLDHSTLSQEMDIALDAMVSIGKNRLDRMLVQTRLQGYESSK
eukprot:gene16163-19236_t